jgi:hypothetical protein
MIVYGLLDPRTGSLRYVGKTHRTAHRRLRRHLAECYLRGDSHKERWLRALLRLGLEPSIIEIERCETADDLVEAERFHIAYARSSGCDLVNATDGGDGTAGMKHTPEAIAKIRCALTGKPKSRQHRERSASAQRGRAITEETRARLCAAYIQRLEAKRLLESPGAGHVAATAHLFDQKSRAAS